MTDFGDYILANRQREQRAKAREHLNGLPALLLQIQRKLEADLRDVSTTEPLSPHGDPLYSAAGLAEHREKLARKIREDAAPVLDDLRTRVYRDARELREHAATLRPRIGDDAGSQMRVQRRWDQARTRLDAGFGLRDLIRSTDDVDTLLGIAEWAPSYLEAQSNGMRTGGIADPYKQQDYSGLLSAIDDRVAELAGGDVQDALTAAREADAAVAGFEHRAGYLDALAAGDTGPAANALGAAIDAHMAEQATRAPLEQLAEPQEAGAGAS